MFTARSLVANALVFATACTSSAPTEPTADGSVEATHPANSAVGSSAATTISATAVASAAAPDPNDGPEARALLRSLEGRYRVVSSSGSDGGHVFVRRIGGEVVLRGDTFAFPIGSLDMFGKPSTTEQRKTIRVVDSKSDPILVDLDHRGDFGATATEADDAAARRDPNSKGWSRHAALRLTGNRLTLALEFPQTPAPRDFKGEGDSEVVVLERLPAVP